MRRMKQLSGLDATFLYLETAAMPMHVGALHVFELPAGFRGKFVTALRKHMAQRLAIAPALRRRLWWMPLNMANPAWVDAEPDLTEHIVEVKLPASAKQGEGWCELEAAVGALHPVLLDRSKPLWKFHVFEGLAPSRSGLKRVAMYTQLHHAAVDGQAAVALANAILDVSPVPRQIEAKPSGRPKTFKLEMTEMLRGVIALQAQKVAGIVRELPSTVGTLKDAAAKAAAGSALLGGADAKGKPGNLTIAPRTVLNGSIGEGRAFACVSLPLAELKALGRDFDATINDMVLAVCSGALRRWFGQHRALPRKSLVAAVPISLREKGDTTSDNQASMSLVSLGTHLADPAARLKHVKAATAAMKGTMGSLKSILPTDFPSLGVPWLMEAATALYGKAKVADRIPQVANLVISNVPGPPMPLYLAGARMLTNYPASIIVHGIGLNITVQSYDQHLDFGLMADAKAMPDVQALAEGIRSAFDDLRALPRPGDAAHEDTATLQDAVVKAGREVAGTVASTVGGTLGRMARSVVKTAVGTAVSSALGGSARPVPKAKASRAKAAPAKRTARR
jgi:WS/DGAT/MGAT family acyltransferase